MSGKSRISNFRAQTTSSAVGQVRDWLGDLREGRIWISNLPWLSSLREKAATAAIDPLQSLFDSCLPFPPLIEFLARDLILHETPMGLEAGAGVD